MKLLMILVCKGTCVPVSPSLKRQGGKCPHNAPPFRRPCLHSMGDRMKFTLVANVVLPVQFCSLLPCLHGAFHCGQIVTFGRLWLLVDCGFLFAESRLRLWLYCGFEWPCWLGGPEIKSHNGLWLCSTDVGCWCQVVRSRYVCS